MLPPFDPDHLLERLDAIPGVGRITAQKVVAELGIDMSRFASHAHATSWAGLAPGKTDTYLGEKYRRIARRRGQKRAAVAVARTILVIIFHMIRNGSEFRELGSTYFDQLKPQSTQQWLTKRLEKLGYKVTLEPFAAVA